MIYNWDNLEIEYLTDNTIHKMVIAEKDQGFTKGPTMEEVLKEIQETKWKLGHEKPNF